MTMEDRLTIKAGKTLGQPNNGVSRLKRKLKTMALWLMLKEKRKFIQLKRKLPTGVLLRMNWARKTSSKLSKWDNRLRSKLKTTVLWPMHKVRKTYN